MTEYIPARCLGKQVAKILASGKEDGLELDRKITLVTEGFGTAKYCELILRDRNRLFKENALTNYIHQTTPEDEQGKLDPVVTKECIRNWLMKELEIIPKVLFEAHCMIVV